MSTKIYIGQRAVDDNVFTVAKKIREVLDPLWAAKFRAAVQEAEDHEGETWADVFMLFGKMADDWKHPIKYDLWNTASEVYKLMEELQDCPIRTFSNLDFGYSVSLMEDGRDASLPPLVLIFSEHAGDEYRKAVEDAGAVTEFGYWNNTDKPDHITKKEWKAREKAWALLDVPATDGVHITHPGKTRALGEFIYNQVKPLID